MGERIKAMWAARSQLYERNSDAMKVEGDAVAVVPVGALNTRHPAPKEAVERLVWDAITLRDSLSPTSTTRAKLAAMIERFEKSESA